MTREIVASNGDLFRDFIFIFHPLLIVFWMFLSAGLSFFPVFWNWFLCSVVLTGICLLEDNLFRDFIDLIYYLSGAC